MQPFKVGEKLSASKMNQLLGLASRAYVGDGFSGGDGPLLIRNTSGDDIDLGQVLGISALDFSATDDLGTFLSQIVFTGVTPVLADHEYKYAVALEPIADGAVGRCALDGVVRVRLNVASADHQWAKIDDGEGVLTTGCIGSAWIVAKESGSTGEMWAVVRFDSSFLGALADYDDEANQMIVKLAGECPKWVTAGDC